MAYWISFEKSSVRLKYHTSVQMIGPLFIVLSSSWVLSAFRRFCEILSSSMLVFYSFCPAHLQYIKKPFRPLHPAVACDVPPMQTCWMYSPAEAREVTEQSAEVAQRGHVRDTTFGVVTSW